jgi:hypothetical protein
MFAEGPLAAKPLRAGSTVKCSSQQAEISQWAPAGIMCAGRTQHRLGRKILVCWKPTHHREIQSLPLRSRGAY